MQSASTRRRALCDDDHDDFREFRRFNEVVPHFEQWEKDGIVRRELFASARQRLPRQHAAQRHCLPYFLEYCEGEQRERWLPGIVSGELITAIAITEPGTGSDLAGIRTRTIRDLRWRERDHRHGPGRLSCLRAGRRG